jgi:acetyl-CoA carboxylase biotin carboxylase subunit
MHRALLELTIEGVETSRDFHLRVMENDDFRRGAISIQWLEERLPALLDIPAPADGVRIAAIAGAMLAEEERQGRRRRSGAVAASPESGAATPTAAPSDDAWRRAARLESLRSS